MRALVLAIIIVTGILCARAQTDSSSNPLPFTEGTYWIYQGFVRYEQAGPENVADAKVTWRMEIERVLCRNDAKAAIVRGFPGDLNWSTGSVTPRESLLIFTNDGRFYLIDPDRAAVTKQKFKDAHVALRDLLEDDDLWFQLPLARGKKFCSDDGVKREDSMHCWVVDEPTQVSLDGIKGLTAKSVTAFGFGYRTNPDDSEMQLVPDVGIISFGYHHHGTVAETELKLVEFHSGP